MVVNKIHIYADVVSFARLLFNSKIREGKDIKHILRCRAEVRLCISEDDLAKLWNDEESVLRKLCDAIDLPCPIADPSLLDLWENHEKIYQDPLGIWFLNLSDENIALFRERYGVWVINAESANDEILYLHHHREYDKDDVVEGETDNGWKNYFAQLPPDKPLPPLNSIVINDRYLINNTNEGTAYIHGFCGLNNLLKLLDAILPKNLAIPFHLSILCQHPKLPTSATDEIIGRFIAEVKELREDYDIVVEVVYNLSRHKRTFHSNYFLFDIDRGYNAFSFKNWKQLCGENDFTLESYMNNPNCSGDTNYETAKGKLAKIKHLCQSALDEPELMLGARCNDDYGGVKRGDPAVRTIQNRLFS